MNKKMPSPGSYFYVWILFRQTHDVMVNVRNRELRKHNITLEYSGTLALVKQLGDHATPAEIARWRYRRPHTVSEVLTNMQKEGLIEKFRDLGRKNLVRIALTPKGEHLHQQSKQAESLKHMFSCLTPREIKQFGSYLEKLRSKALKEFAISYHETPIHEQFIEGKLEYNVWRVFRRTNDIMVRIREKDLSRYGLSLRLSSVLYFVNLLGDRATPAEVARRRYRSPNSISNFLIRIERDGLVERHKDLDKKNQVRAILTEKGEQAYRQSTRRESIRRIFRRLSPGEMKQFATYLEKLHARSIVDMDDEYLGGSH
jgi:DNA-binding MarR family transcriptional regulator